MKSLLPQRKTLRLRHYDYAQAVYFVTVCTHHRASVLGSIVDGEMHPSELGRTVEDSWSALPTLQVGVALDEFVVMPNRFHGIAAHLHSQSRAR